MLRCDLHPSALDFKLEQGWFRLDAAVLTEFCVEVCDYIQGHTVQVTVVATEALLPESVVQRCLADRIIGCFLAL